MSGLVAKLPERNHHGSPRTRLHPSPRTTLNIVSSETLDERFESLEQNDQIEALLLELKESQPRLA